MSDTLRIEDRGGVRVLSLSRGKANALTTPFCEEIHAAAHEAEEDPAVRGVVLTSASPKIFCAGFDLAELAHAEPAAFAQFIRKFDTLFFDLYLLGKPLVAALTGHAVAGGALLAATADFRFAAEGPGTIGLPEVTLGVHVPRHCVEAMRATVGEQALTHWALLGETMPFAEARDLGRHRPDRPAGDPRRRGGLLRGAPRRSLERSLRGDQERPPGRGVREGAGRPARRPEGVHRLLVLGDGTEGDGAGPREDEEGLTASP